MASALSLPLARSARASVLVAAWVIAAAGIVAGAVRLLPWLLDPSVPWRVAVPFARGLVAVALESALLVGWPIGWALACARAVESGEARVLATLGERPRRTIARLLPQGVGLACLLAAVAVVYGSDAGAPGRVATELVAHARAACTAARAPTTYAVPFTEMTWLCAPGRPPRLVGEAPGAMHGAMLTASGARIAGDFRSIELDDARLLLATQPPLAVHVATMSLRGMAPWARASTLPAALRASLLAFTAASVASLAAWLVLSRGVRGPALALALGAVGPVASLGLLRLLERADARPSAFLLLPLTSCAACAAVAALLHAASVLRPRLRQPSRAASTFH